MPVQHFVLALSLLIGKVVEGQEEFNGRWGMASDPCEERLGPITLQGDHGPIEIRAITVIPLIK